MKSTYKERLNRVTCLQSIVSNVGTLESGKAEPRDVVVTGLLDLLLAVDAPETVLIVDESESMRVVASNPKLHSDKINVARLTADIGNCLTQNKVRSCNLIRLGGTGPAGNRRTSPSTESRSYRAFGKTLKAEKTAYVLRNALIRVPCDAQFIVMSDFRSHMWRRNLNALIAACPRVTLVHLVDIGGITPRIVYSSSRMSMYSFFTKPLFSNQKRIGANKAITTGKNTPIGDSFT